MSTITDYRYYLINYHEAQANKAINSEDFGELLECCDDDSDDALVNLKAKLIKVERDFNELRDKLEKEFLAIRLEIYRQHDKRTIDIQHDPDEKTKLLQHWMKMHKDTSSLGQLFKHIEVKEGKLMCVSIYLYLYLFFF